MLEYGDVVETDKKKADVSSLIHENDYDDDMKLIEEIQKMIDSSN
jgi:hypothetical protein